MKLSETRQLAVNNNEAKAMFSVNAIGPERAADYARGLFEMRVRGWGDETRALDDVVSMSGMSPRSFKRLMKGETKDPSVRMFAGVRAAYLNYCRTLIKQLQHKIDIEKEIHGCDAFENIGARIEVLAREVEAKLDQKIQPERE